MFELMSSNPCFASFHKQFQIIIRQIVEVGQFPLNVPPFIEMIDRCSTNLNKHAGSQLHKLDKFEFPVQQKQVVLEVVEAEEKEPEPVE